MGSIPQFTIRELLDAGVHFGHKRIRWNPKMSPYIYGIKDDVHIIDLQQTAPLLHTALKKIFDVAKNNGRILFVATKEQASQIVAEAALRCGQFYVNHRWLGGMMTNWETVSKSIKTLEDLEAIVTSYEEGKLPNYTKKEVLDIKRDLGKLEKSLGGIRTLAKRPDLIFIIDTNKESLAVKEAQKLGIPIIAIADSNTDPDGIDFVVPGNDDATRAIKLYCKLVSDTILGGIHEAMIEAGIDIGAAEDLNIEALNEKQNEAKRAKSQVKKMPENKRHKTDKAAAPIEGESFDEALADSVTKEAAQVDEEPKAKKAPSKKPVVETASTEEAPAKPKKPAAKKAPASEKPKAKKPKE